eukprot:2997532-Amphidinium_carterae.2
MRPADGLIGARNQSTWACPFSPMPPVLKFTRRRHALVCTPPPCMSGMVMVCIDKAPHSYGIGPDIGQKCSACNHKVTPLSIHCVAAAGRYCQACLISASNTVMRKPVHLAAAAITHSLAMAVGCHTFTYSSCARAAPTFCKRPNHSAW